VIRLCCWGFRERCRCQQIIQEWKLLPVWKLRINRVDWLVCMYVWENQGCMGSKSHLRVCASLSFCYSSLGRTGGSSMRDGRSAYQCVFAGNSEAVR